MKPTTPELYKALAVSRQQRTESLRDLRYMVVLYAALVVHLSLYPYADWRNLGVGPLDYLSTPWIPPQQRFLFTDALFNVIGYIPLGALLSAALSRRLKGAGNALATLALGGGLSFVLEAIQTYLPSRVPSKMDLATNVLGVFAGLVFSRPAIKTLIDGGHLLALRRRWMEDPTSFAFMCTVLWLFALFAPQTLPMYTGPWLGNAWLEVSLADVPYLYAWVDRLSPFEDGIETALVALSASGAWTLGLAQTRTQSPRLRMVVVLMAFSLALAWLGPQTQLWLQNEPMLLTEYFDSNETLGILIAIGVTVVLALTGWRRTALAKTAFAFILTACVCSIFLPGYSPMGLSAGHSATSQLLVTLSAASDWVGAVWPALGLTAAWRLSRP